MLTALGMVIGTASLILSSPSHDRQAVHHEPDTGIGANMVYAYYEGGGNAAVSTVQQDLLTVDDMRAVRQQVPGIQAASP